MLVVKAEIWPHGEAGDRFEIARIGLINRRSARGLADYDVIALHDREKQERVAQNVLLSHVRSLGWQPLVARALTEPGEELLHHDYVQEIAEILRKG